MSTFRDGRSRYPNQAQPGRVPPAPTDLILTAKHHGWLALVYLAFVFYGSLIPFHFTPLSMAETLEHLREGFTTFELGSRTDAVTNLLLFVPLSYLAMAYLCVDRPWIASMQRAPVVFVFCLVSGFTVETIQVWFPPRSPDLRDVTAMMVGTVVGVGAWLVNGQRWTNWCRSAWNTQGETGLASRLLPLYLVVLFFVHVLPLDLTMHPRELYHKYKEKRIILRPFDSPFVDHYEAAEKYLWTLLYFAPMGVLLVNFSNPKWREWPTVHRVAAIGFLASGTLEFFQLFVNSRVADVTDVIMGGFSVILGWAATLLYGEWQRYRMRYQRTVGYQKPLPLPPLSAVLAVLWVAVAVFMTWRPFDFRFDPEFVKPRTEKISWLPLLEYYGQNYLHSIEEFMRKLLLYVVGGALVTFSLPERRDPRLVYVVAGLAVLMAVILEIGQLYLPTRVFSLDDILIEAVGAWIGCVLGNRAWGLKRT